MHQDLSQSPPRCDTEPSAVPLHLLGQQRKESNTTFQLLFSSQGLCARLDTGVGSLRSSRSWECSSLMVWMQMTLKMSLRASQNHGMALSPRDLNKAFG